MAAKHSTIGDGTLWAVTTTPASSTTTLTSVGRIAADRDHGAVEQHAVRDVGRGHRVLHPRRQRIRLELRRERLDGGVVAQGYGELGHRTARRGLGDGVDELEVDRVELAAARRADHHRGVAPRRVVGLLVATGTQDGHEQGDGQDSGHDGSEKAVHSHGTVAPAAGFRQASRVPARRRAFTRAELESFRDAEVPDLLPLSGLKLLFVGINPGLWTAATQTTSRTR